MGIAAVAAGAGIAASGVSIANGLDSGGGGGGAGSTSTNGGGGSVPTGYQPTAQPQFDQYYQQLIGNMMPYAQSIPGETMPFNANAYGAAVNNPYAARAQGYADTAGNAAWQALAPWAWNAGSEMNELGKGAAAAAPRILDTGFDPQNALYDRTQQRLKDQLSATNSMSGLSGTPYGAGVMGQGLENFNIDWQNNLLNRQVTAANAYGNLNTTAGRDFSAATDLGQIGIGAYQEAGQLPYQEYLRQQNDKFNASNAYSGAATNALGLDGNTMNALAAYMKLGQSATSVGQAGQNQGFNQGQTLGANFGAGLQGLSSGISSLSNLFGPSNTSVTPSNPASYGGGSYGNNADLVGQYPGFDFSQAG